MIASVATLELVADVSVDECVFECDLPPEYARFTANKPWEDGSLLIGSLDPCLLAPGPLIHLEARPRYKGEALSPSGYTEPWHRPCRWGSPWSRLLRSPSVPPPLCAPHTGALRWLGWAADAVASSPSRAVTPGACRSECARSRAGVASDRRTVAHNEAPARPLRRGRGKFAGGEDPYALVFSAATGASSFQKSSSSGFSPIEDALKCGSRPALRWAV